MKKIRLGMVGGGIGAFIGAVHRIASRIDGRYELVAGALSADPAKATESGIELGLSPERIYSDFHEMAKREAARDDGIDVVAIVTPNHMHFPVAKAFLDAGIHVICDKPLTSDLADAYKLQEIASKSGQLFVLTHNYTGYPLVRQAKQMIADGQLGKLRVIQVEYPQDWMSTDTEHSGNKQAEWRTDPKRSGPAGCLGDIGTHAYNLVRFVSGLKLEQVSAELTTFVDGRQLDDNVSAMLRFEQNVKGMLWSSQVAPGNENGLRFRVYGEKGGLEWSQENPNQLVFSLLGQAVQILTRAGNGYLETAPYLTRTPGGHPEGYLEGFANLYYEAADCIVKVKAGESAEQVLSKSLLPQLKDGVDGMRFINAVIASSEQNSNWISIEDF
ncbi:Gfo/Idh/MocA family protein [Vibrio sp. VB16]|uniref:Gfo/Idh/MocA family protein n=1 Tax=Vibrio sp. VB16 TaxID=2785746 RepID=UPI00189D1616|nr:Gfo/Idh/MocA family oxidoreductase [Vibrio sp. VB16]UGA55485.1 Gfo/Idh/MocA family oxidoreductase [Vibrio sp. VB16]